MSSQSIYFAVKKNKIIQTHYKYNYQFYSRKLQNDFTVSSVIVRAATQFS